MEGESVTKPDVGGWRGDYSTYLTALISVCEAILLLRDTVSDVLAVRDRDGTYKDVLG